MTKDKLKFRYRNGYYIWTYGSGDEWNIGNIHRLVGVAKYGFDAIKNKHVHHKNEIRADNSFENIELVDPSEHLSYHHQDKELDSVEGCIGDYSDGGLLQKLYHDEGMSFNDIADELDTSYGNVWHWMNKYDVELRDRSEAISEGKNHGEPWRDEELLEHLYYDRNFSQFDIADEFDTTQANISYWMKKFDIEARSEGAPGHVEKKSVSDESKFTFENTPIGEAE